MYNEIIEEALMIVKNGLVFHECTAYLQSSDIEGFSAEEYKKLDAFLQAIRQDFAKILVTMNSIDRVYSLRQNEKYIPTYLSIGNQQVSEELCCMIEYLFVKYRVLLEYVQKIMELCIPKKFAVEEYEAYKKIDIKSKKNKKVKRNIESEKYQFLLKYVSEKIKDKTELLSIQWFQNLRVDRNSIVHNGGTCVVFDDKDELLFRILLPNDLEVLDEKLDSFYSTYNNLIRYNYYWAYHISSLIVFIETIFRFMRTYGHLSKEKEKFIKSICKVEYVEELEYEVVREKQDVLVELMCLVLGKSRC